MKTKLKPASEVFNINKSADFTSHNNEVKELWDSYKEGTQPRVPMILGVNCRYTLLDPKFNPEGITFREVFEDPEIMLETILRFAYFMRYFLPSDRQMGLPDHWTAYVVGMNTYEAEWFGAKREYIDGDMPDCRPFLLDDNKRALFTQGLPDPFANNAKFSKECCEFFQQCIDRGFLYEGVPLTEVSPPFMGTDGPFTVACAIRGVTEICLDIYEDPDYAHELLNYITEATILRIKAWRKLFGRPEITPDAAFSFADDSIQILSSEMYQEFILPYHKKLRENLGSPGFKAGMHLCGDATHHFKFLRDNLNVYHFDTGYPVKHGELVKSLGPDVEISGGPTVGLLLYGTPDEIKTETKRILNEVMPHTRRFILRDANNLPPLVPEANIAAMYEVAKNTYY